MAEDLGLLAGLAEGLREGMGAYRDQTRYIQEQALKKRQIALQEQTAAAGMFEKGIGPKDGGFEETALPANEQAVTKGMITQAFPGLDIGDQPLSRLGSERLMKGTAAGLSFQLGKEKNTQSAASAASAQATKDAAEGLVTNPDGTKTYQPISAGSFNSLQLTHKKLNPTAPPLKPEDFTERDFKSGSALSRIYGMQTTLKGQETTAATAAKKMETKKSGGIKPEKPPTPNQFKSARFGRNMELGMKDFDDIEASGYDSSTPAESLRSGLLNKLGDFGEYFKSDNQKTQQQAERNFINAILRDESGANIPTAEMESYIKQYFTRPGDSERLRAQKKSNRIQSLEGIKAEAGKAWGETPSSATGLLKTGPKKSRAEMVDELRRAGKIK